MTFAKNFSTRSGNRYIDHMFVYGKIYITIVVASSWKKNVIWTGVRNSDLEVEQYL
jgi:hypothetical protein